VVARARPRLACTRDLGRHRAGAGDALPAGAVLAGYSLGARLALAAALRRGDQLCGTLLVGGHVGPADERARAERAALDAGRAAALRSEPLAAFVAEWEALPLFATQRALPAQQQARQRAARLEHDPQALAWAWRSPDWRRCPTCERRWPRRDSPCAS